VVPHARQVLHPAAPDHDDGVLLQVMAFTRDVSGDLRTVGEPHTRHLAHGRVGLLGRGGVNPRTDTPALRT